MARSLSIMDQDQPAPGTRIVIVEDEPIIRDLTVCELEDHGFTVVEFASADAALPYLQHNGDDLALVITDVQMPGSMNGLQLVDMLFYLWPNLRILVTSGGPLVNPSKLPPAARFMAKPWRPTDFACRVEEMARARA